MRSILLSATTTRAPAGRSRITARSASVVRPASTTTTMASTSSRLRVAERFIRSLRRDACLLWMPGVSTKTNWAPSAVRMPVTRWRVVCAFFDVMLTFSPTRWLSSVDLPTFGRPTIATWPQRCAGGGGASATGGPAVDRAGNAGVRQRSGRLLRRAPARADGGGHDAERGHAALDGERLRMRGAGGVDDR